MNMAWLIVFFVGISLSDRFARGLCRSSGATALLPHFLDDPGIAMLEQVL